MTNLVWSNQLFAVAVGTPVTIGRDKHTLPFPLTVTAVPGSGGALLVEYQVASFGTWQEWPAGAVSTATTYVLTGPVRALRFTATTQLGTVEVAQ